MGTAEVRTESSASTSPLRSRWADRAVPPIPEQLFAAGYAACFLSALKLVARRSKADVRDVAVTTDVGLNANGAGGFVLSVALHVEMSGVDQQAAEGYVATAHSVCPYSNATRGNIDVTIDTVVA